jgi:hypothetical protein
MNVEKLDKTLTYCIGINPAPNVACEARTYQATETIHFNERWTQVGILFFDVFGWSIIHADIEGEGVACEPLDTTLKQAACQKADVFVFPCAFSLHVAKSLLGTPFSWKKLRAFKTNRWPTVDDGVTCAELLALCSDEVYKVNKYAAKPCQKYRPIDWQEIGKGKIERLEP